MAKDFKKLAKNILENVGGEENVDQVWHCATRLRFKLIDKSKANKDVIEKLEDVIAVVESGGQFQIVIGNCVTDVYEKIGEVSSVKIDPVDNQKNVKSVEKTSPLNTAIDTISGIFQPMLAVLCGSGILKGLLMIGTYFEILSNTSGTYIILNAASDSVFHFLPVILASTASKKFKANQFVAVTIAGALIYPSITELFGQGASITFLGVPVILMSYTSSVIPIILAVYVLSKVERGLNKITPEAVKNFIIPAVSLLVVVPLTFLVIGPIGTYVGDLLATGYSAIYNLNPLLAGTIIGAGWQILVIFGVHWSFIPIITNNIALVGYDTMLAMLGPSNFAQAGASLGVFLKTKDSNVKQIAGSAAIAGIFGITEPTIYGVTLKYKKPFVVAIIAGALGGLIGGMSGAASTSSVVVGLLTLPAFIGDGFIIFIIACLVAYFSAAIGTYFFGYNDKMINATVKSENNQQVNL